VFHLSRSIQALPEISGVENELFLRVHPGDGAVVCIAAILHLILCPGNYSEIHFMTLSWSNNDQGFV
jgi:hypothetical protein